MPEHVWVTSTLSPLRESFRNQVSSLSERLTQLADEYDAMQERERLLREENARLRAASERITAAEWRLISLALESCRLAAGDDIRLHKDHERAADAEQAERDYEALNVVLGKVARRLRAG